MSDATLINQCILALGRGEPDDYIIAPTSHAEQLTENAPELAAILNGSAVHVAARQFEEADAEANKAQANFRKLTRRVRWAVLLVATLAGTLLVLGAVLPDNGGWHWLIRACALTSVVAGAAGSMWLYRIRKGRLLEHWMTVRATAESRRLAFFEAVTALRKDSTPTITLLQLEYFRRFQLDVQVSYYGKRGRQHRASAERILALGSWAVLLSSAATLAAGALASQRPVLAVLAGLAVVGTALSSFVSAQESVNQDSRTAERYQRTRQVLQKLECRLDAVREALSRQHTSALPAFVDAVHEQLSLEHRQWLDDSESRSQGLAALEKALAQQDKSEATG